MSHVRNTTLYLAGPPCENCGKTERYRPFPSKLAAGDKFGPCVHCHLERARANHIANPGRKAETRLMRRYGLTRQQAQIALISAQGDLCASCGIFAKLVVDHNHRTGAARGLVCQRCNVVAGGLESPIRSTVESYLTHSKVGGR